MKHKKLITCLQNAGLDGKDIRLISIYNESKWQQLNIFLSYINIKSGVRKGCVLSSSLNNLYTEDTFKQVE